MQKINFQNLPSTTTPINATNLNAIQANVENAINLVSNYLSSETVVGTWINGNNIYRQTQQISKSSSGLITLLSIPSLDVIVNICTYLKRDDLSGVYKNINNWGQTSGDYGTAFVEGNDIKFDSPYTGTLYITIEYTKTTD